MKKLYSTLFMLVAGLGTFAQTVNYDWSFEIGTSNRDLIYDTKVDGQGNVYTIGNFEGTADFDPSVAASELDNIGSTDVFIAKYNSNGNLIWAKQIGGGAWDTGYRLHIDNNNNVFGMGGFRATVDFDPGAGMQNLSSNGDFDAFIVKLDENGDYVWARSFGGASTDFVMDLNTDDSGNIYSIGYFNGTVDFDPGINVTEHSSNGAEDVFMLKLNVNGNFVWAKAIGSTGADRPRSIVVSDNGSFYVSGEFQETVNFDSGMGTDNHTSNGGYDAFISKYDLNGDYVWTNTFGGVNDDYAFSLSLGLNSDVFCLGSFQETVDFDPGMNTVNAISNGDHDAFLSKLDSDGNFEWVKTFGGTGDDKGLSMTIDDEYYIHITGHFSDTVDFEPGNGQEEKTAKGEVDVFISTFNIQGELMWNGTIGGNSTEVGRGISADNNGGLYVAGSFESTVDFNPGADTLEASSLGQYDGFLVKLDIQNVGIEDLVAEDVLLSVFPNPSSNYIAINANNEIISAITITDISGKVVRNVNGINQKQISLNVQQLKNGVYFIGTQVGSKLINQKFIKN